MRSFRLDPDSVSEFLETWPALLVGLPVACLLAYIGMKHPWGRIATLLFCGIYGGFLLRGRVAHRLREQYPSARYHWLLTAGMATLVFGVAIRMGFPEVQGTPFDLTWVGVSFSLILAFVVLNRKDEDVVR